MLCRICTAHKQYTKQGLDDLGSLTHTQKYEIQNKMEDSIPSEISRSSRRTRLSVRRDIRRANSLVVEHDSGAKGYTSKALLV